MLSNHDPRHPSNRQIKADLQSLVNLICDGYCHPPKVILVKGIPAEDGEHAGWWNTDGRILLNRKTGRWALLHELAHHFQYRVVLPSPPRARARHSHDAIFAAAYALVLNRLHQIVVTQKIRWTYSDWLNQEVVGRYICPETGEINCAKVLSETVRNNRREINREPELEIGWDWSFWQIHNKSILDAAQVSDLAGHHSNEELLAEPARLVAWEAELEKYREGIKEIEEREARREARRKAAQAKVKLIVNRVSWSPYLLFCFVVIYKALA